MMIRHLVQTKMGRCGFVVVPSQHGNVAPNLANIARARAAMTRIGYDRKSG